QHEIRLLGGIAERLNEQWLPGVRQLSAVYRDRIPCLVRRVRVAAQVEQDLELHQVLRLRVMRGEHIEERVQALLERVSRKLGRRHELLQSRPSVVQDLQQQRLARSKLMLQ